LHTATFVTRGLSKSYNQVAYVPSSNVTYSLPRSPSINCTMVAALVAGRADHRDRGCFFVNVHPDIFCTLHIKNAPFASDFGFA
jgi:hypothetical protein